jgi:aspartate/methionine/tyrosine aminotransferase
LEELGKVIHEFPNLIVFSDETYRDLSENPISLLNACPYLHTQVITQRSTSKDFVGEPGIRGAFMLMPTSKLTNQKGQKIEYATAINAAILQTITSSSTLVQELIIKTISAELQDHIEANAKEAQEYHNWKHEAVEHYAHKRQLATEHFTEAGFEIIVKPEGGFFLFAKLPTALTECLVPDEIKNFNGQDVVDIHEKIGINPFDPYLRTDEQAAKFLLLCANIVVIPGSGFECKPEDLTVRISCACDDEVIKKIKPSINHAIEQMVLESATQVEIPDSPQSHLSPSNGSQLENGILTQQQSEGHS